MKTAKEHKNTTRNVIQTLPFIRTLQQFNAQMLCVSFKYFLCLSSIYSSCTFLQSS